MAGYLLWRMFYIAPWYDETVTYREFIHRGTWYSMTHWPLPTNHVFYCVLSSILDIFGNPYLTLRGVSYAAALVNLILLFGCLCRKTKPEPALAGCMIYSGFWLVMDQSVQGRGYTLSNVFVLTCILCVHQIFHDRREGLTVKKRFFAGYAISMFLALYTVPTNFYWIFALCAAIFVLCCLEKEWKLLWRFVRYGIGSALMTVCMYSFIWISTGLRQLGTSDITFVSFLKKFPQIVLTGIEDMLSNEIIQPVGRKAAISGMGEWLRELAEQILGTGSMISAAAAVVVGCLMLISFAGFVKTLTGRSEFCRSEKRRGIDFFLLFSWISIWAVPILLVLQGTLPFYRCFLWICIPLIIILADAADRIRFCARSKWESNCGKRQKDKWESRWQGAWKKYGWPLVCLCLCLGIYAYGKQSFEENKNENEIQEILDHTEGEMEKVIWGDARTEAYVYFVYGTDFEEDPYEPDHIIVKKAALDPEYQGYWDDYYTYGDLP